MKNPIKMVLIFIKRSIFKKIVFYVIIVLEYIVPKKPDLIIFGSDSGRYAIGNPRIIYDCHTQDLRTSHAAPVPQK